MTGALKASEKGMPFMLKSTSTSLILLGILAVIVGVIAIAWQGVTILALSSCSRSTRSWPRA
jgi:uncharacterized membrane protein HdeD (DUF308 family)